MLLFFFLIIFFFFNDTATTEIYTLSLHDALPIYSDAVPPEPLRGRSSDASSHPGRTLARADRAAQARVDRKSTRLNSSHMSISYAVFCLKKKKKKNKKKIYNENKTQTESQLLHIK